MGDGCQCADGRVNKGLWANIDDSVCGLSLKPLPGRVECGPVDGIGSLRRRVDHDSACSTLKLTEPVEASESLPQTVGRGALRHESVEVEIGAHLDRLRRHNDQAASADVAPATCAQARPERCQQPVVVRWT